MQDLAIFTVTFESKTGEVSNELNEALNNFMLDIEYKAKQLAQNFPGVQFKVEE